LYHAHSRAPFALRRGINAAAEETFARKSALRGHARSTRASGSAHEALARCHSPLEESVNQIFVSDLAPEILLAALRSNSTRHRSPALPRAAGSPQPVGPASHFISRFARKIRPPAARAGHQMPGAQRRLMNREQAEQVGHQRGSKRDSRCP
jgi:hypothetical protein